MSSTSIIPEGTQKLIQTPAGVHFEAVAQEQPTGQAYVATSRAAARREEELAAGRKRVAENAALNASRPPRIISEKERMAEGGSVPVFRPNMPSLDRLNSGLGPLMRRVGSKVEAPASTETGG
jgi:hypothetical protein